MSDVRTLMPMIEKLRHLHTRLPPPGPHDWLANHQEPGQTVREYFAGNPVTPRGERAVIYIQPIGDFTATQREIVTIATDFTQRFYNLEVRVREDIPLSAIPKEATRRHWLGGMKQILTTHVLHEILKPDLPADAAACIAFTPSDLWPGAGWNFVFGWASFEHRVGVWSLYRYGKPDRGRDEYRMCLLRTMKVAVHELGHMFSVQHCIKYQCCMCGSNHRDELDLHPLWLCPECMAKICWATATEPVVRYRRLAEFAREHGFEAERIFYEKSIKVLC